MKHLFILLCTITISASSLAQRPEDWENPFVERLFDSMGYRGFDPQKYFALDLIYWQEGTNKAVLSYADTTSGRWLYGLINQDGDTLSPPLWPQIREYRSEVAVVLTALDDKVLEYTSYSFFLYNNGLSGAVNTDGEIVVPFTFTYLDWFIDSVSIFSTQPLSKIVYKKLRRKMKLGRTPYSKLGLINNQGKILVPEIYREIIRFRHNIQTQLIYYTVKKKNLWGVIDKYGNIIIPIKHRKHEQAQEAFFESTRVEGYD